MDKEETRCQSSCVIPWDWRKARGRALISMTSPASSKVICQTPIRLGFVLSVGALTAWGFVLWLKRPFSLTSHDSVQPNGSSAFECQRLSQLAGPEWQDPLRGLRRRCLQGRHPAGKTGAEAGSYPQKGQLDGSVKIKNHFKWWFCT